MAHSRFGNLSFINQFSKKRHRLASTASDRKDAKFNMIFHDSSPKNFFSKHRNKAEFKCLDDSEVLNSNLSVLKTSAASITSVVSTASMNLLDSLISSKKSTGHYGLIIPSTQMTKNSPFL